MDTTDTAVSITNNQPTTMHIIIENQPDDTKSRLIIQPIPSKQKEQFQSKSSQIDTKKSLQASTGFQTHHDRLVTTYQIAHCNVIPASASAGPTEYPVQEAQQGSFRKSRVAQVADSFAQSLRKYPRALPEFARSSEVIERLLSSTLAKRLGKSKKSHSKRNKKTKCHHEVPCLKKLHLYPRRQRIPCDCSKTAAQVAMNVQSTSSGMSSPKKQFTDFGLREMSRLQRMGGGAEVRYLNDVRKCIRDAIKHVWDNDAMVCPEIERRFLQHQKEYHSPNNDMKQLKNEVDTKMCYKCKKIVPCECPQPTIKDSPTNIRLRVGKCCDRSTSLEDHMNTSSCCHLCKEEQEYSSQLLKQVIDWQQEIPLNADCSEEDKAKRQQIIRTLVKSLLRFKGMEDKQKEEIKKVLDILPMWRPVDKNDRDLFINNLIENLIIRISLLKDEDNSLKTIINDWIDKFFFKQKTLDKRVVRKDNILNKFMVKIASLKLNEKSNKNEYNEAVRSQVNDLFKKLLVQSPDVNFINKAADELIHELNKVLSKKSDTLNRKYGTSKEVTMPETSKVLLDMDLNKILENGNIVQKTTAQNKVKDDIKKIIEITKTNNLDPRTESLLMEALIMKVKALSSSMCSNSDFIKNNTNKNTNMQEIIEMKVKQVVDQLPLAIANNMKSVLKDEIVDVISKKMGTESSLKLPKSLKEEIRSYVRELVSGVLKANAGDMRNQKKIQNDLTNLIADQIIRCDNTSNFKEKAYTLLREANVSKSEMEDVYNSLLRHTIDMSLSLKHKTHLSAPLSRDETITKRTDQFDSKRTENEVISFISHISSNLNTNLKEKLMISANQLADKMEKIISDVKYSSKEKEEKLAKLVFIFFRNHGLPVDDSSKHRIIKWIHRLLNSPQEASTPKQKLTDNYISNPTLSSIQQDDDFKTLSQGSLVQIYENPSLNNISHEVVKCIERIPSGRMISHDRNYHRMVAKEIAQRLREAANQSSNPETALKQTVIRWLPKLVKKPNETELIWMTSILKKIMEDKELSEFSTRPGYQRHYMGQAPGTPASEYQSTEAIRNAIMNWLKETSLYQNRNIHEKRFQENLVSGLAHDLNQVISDTEKSINDDTILKLLETRIKQFPMEATAKCDKSYHRSLAFEILKYLKDAQLIPSHKNSSLDEVTRHVLRWIDKIPHDRIISQDVKHQKAIAKEIAKRVIETKNQTQNPDLALECEVLRWLPKIVKEPTETELHGLKGNLKKIVNYDASINGLLTETNQYVEALKYALMNWLKDSEMYHRRNKQEELCQETVMANLALDLDRINNNLPPNQNIDFERYILKMIESRLKELPLNQRVQNTDNYNYTMAIDLLNYLKDLNLLRSIRKTPDESKKNVTFWIESLPLKWAISTHEARKTADRIYSILSDYLDNDLGSTNSNKHLKSIIINVLKELPLREEFKNEQKLEILVENLFIILKHHTKDPYGTNNSVNIAYSGNNSTHLLATELANKCAYIPIDSAQGPEDARKVREELVSGLVNIINKQHLNYAWRNGDTFYETIIRNEVEQLLNTLKVNEHCKRNLFSFKNYLVDVMKDVFKTKQKEKFIENYRQQLYDIIENTLPTNTTLSSDQQTSFNDLKEKLVEAFVTLVKTTDVNTGKFKVILKNEVNKFCNDYLRRYPATPLDTDKLCNNLFSVLQNIRIPETKSPNYSDEINYTKNKIKDYLEELPLKVTDENILLRNHFVNLIQYYLENPSEIQHSNLRDKITEKIKQFTFLSEHKPNFAEITENILKILYNNDQMNKAHRQTLQQVSRSLQNNNVRTLDKLDKQTSNINIAKETLTYDLPVEDGDNIIRDHFKESFREYIRYQQVNTGNKDVQVNGTPNGIENQINTRPDLIGKNESDSPTCSEFNCCGLRETENCLETLTCQRHIRTKCAQTEKVNDLSPRIIVKEYYWDSNDNEMVSSHQELQGMHNELRRTVPSLPFSKVDLPAPHCRSRRQCLKSPCISHISMAEGNIANFQMNQPSVEEEIWATRKLPVTRYRQSNISLGRNIDRPDVILKPVSESKTKRQNFCNDQNGYGIFDDDKRRSKDCCLTSELTERGSVTRPHVNPATDVGYSLAQERDDKKKCNCYGYVHQKIIGGPSPESSGVVSHHSQCPSNINNCVKCRGGICLHPSYIYFN
ncbi:PREDICTED: uncharacterized protein LOC106124832 isoform X2 [Papilio xuthus]|uniref:Uncharacterized protein LOC106124832 isoform X2 n=1 Tax=Papilio xuthus TaxID=66420 RepID=A0AAJ6ZQD8_PAPXU|nr:PREDICTED: uncharacterized protein LOC106124832 isoform X2 [Papilio xuthus]